VNWTGWLLLAISLIGLYAIGLIGYRIMLATKKLRTEVARAEGLIDELQNVEYQTVELAKPTSGDDFEQALVNREQLKLSRAKKAEERKRRLIERISSIEVDKR
jgi:hypothetical protein